MPMLRTDDELVEVRSEALAEKNAPPGNLACLADGREIACARFAAVGALKRLKGLWKTPVMLLLLESPRRFAELERELAPISAKVLTQRLRELERGGYVERRELVADPPKVVEYRLTRRGEAIRPVFEALAAWNGI